MRYIAAVMDPSSALAALFDSPVRAGLVTWIGLRPARRALVRPVDEAMAVRGQGLHGDRYKTSIGGGRQVTLIEAESLAAIASYLGRPCVTPEDLRRNIVVSGINLLALKGKTFRLGTALLEWSGECHPCSRMEETFGPGGYNAVRGRGGITARVLESGLVKVGDAVVRE